MSRCLCCGKEIAATASPQEKASRWHTACVKKFFRLNTLPALDLDDTALARLAEENTAKGFTVPGVQKKLSLHLSRCEGETPRLTLVDYPTGYILKPQTVRYPALPESEAMVMAMAQRTGIRTVPFALLQMKDGKFAYITRRIDRVLPKKGTETMQLAMEDFCQLDGRLTEDKYRGSYERCARIIQRWSCQAGFDLSELYLRLVFCFTVGNNDMHLKNFSLIERKPAGGEYTLSEAYDLLPVNCVLPEDTEQMALTLNGKKRAIHRRDFLKYAAAIGLTRPAAEKMLEKILSMESRYRAICQESYLPDELKERFGALLTERMNALRKNTD